MKVSKKSVAFLLGVFVISGAVIGYDSYQNKKEFKAIEALIKSDDFAVMSEDEKIAALDAVFSSQHSELSLSLNNSDARSGDSCNGRYEGQSYEYWYSKAKPWYDKANMYYGKAIDYRTRYPIATMTPAQRGYFEALIKAGDVAGAKADAFKAKGDKGFGKDC